METKTKLLIALLLAISLVTAITAWANTVYLPLVPKDPTNTPTATLAFTVTPTPTQTKTATPTRTPTQTPGVYILDIFPNPSDNPLNEYVVIENNGNSSVNMTGWGIKAEKSGKRYNFPEDFTLGADKSVKVWTKTGQNTSSNLFWGSSVPVWDDTRDTGYLKNKNGDTVDTYSYGD